MPNSLESMLGFTDGDLAANRGGVLSGRQAARLCWSGGWRAFLGPALAVGGAALALLSDYFAFAAFGLVVLALGLYLAWRGFAFLADAATVDVAFVTGPLSGHVVTYRSSKTYYAVIGPVRKRINEKAYNALPVRTVFHLYYAPGCRSLLSSEPANVDEPRPAHPFGADAGHAWNRLRWRWIVLTVGLFGLFAAGHIVADAHPAQGVPVAGIVSDFYETHSKSGTHEHLYLAGDQTEYLPSLPDTYTPPIDSFQRLVGKRVVLYVNSGTTYVIALRDAEMLHAGDYYLHPENQLYWTVFGGGSLGILSLAALLFAAHPLVRGLRAARTSSGSTTPLRLTPPTVRALHHAWPAALTLIALAAASLLILANLANISWGGAPHLGQVIAVVAGVALLAGIIANLARFRTKSSGG